MNRLFHRVPFQAGRAGFTMVELLVTVGIVAMLAAMVSGVLAISRLAAREAATRATIAKINNVIMTKYESYRTRRVPLSEAQMVGIAQASFGWTPPDPTRPTWTNPNNESGFPPPSARDVLGRPRYWGPYWVGLVTLAAKRDLMRMEMPERWSDIWDFNSNGPRPPVYLPSCPKLFQGYINRCSTISGGGYVFRPSDRNYPAKCLYLVVTMVGGPDARRQFSETEVTTDPADGFSMFVDGWGHPIYCLRWASGFISTYGADSDVQTGDTSLDHDPFDPRGVDATAFRLMPLVYSAGRDGQYGLWTNQYDEDRTPPTTYYWTNWNGAYAQIIDRKWNVPVHMGQPIPMDSTGTLGTTHYDNIHNHQSLTEAR